MTMEQNDATATADAGQTPVSAPAEDKEVPSELLKTEKRPEEEKEEKDQTHDELKEGEALAQPHQPETAAASVDEIKAVQEGANHKLEKNNDRNNANAAAPPLMSRFSSWRKNTSAATTSLWRQNQHYAARFNRSVSEPLQQASLSPSTSNNNTSTTTNNTTTTSTSTPPPPPSQPKRAVSSSVLPPPGTGGGEEDEEEEEGASSSDGSLSYDEDDNTSADGGSVASSSVWSSTVSGAGSSSKLPTFQWAAASVVDSVGYFRGRYSDRQQQQQQVTVMTTSPSPKQQQKQVVASSQTSRILSSPQASHLQQLLNKLEPHQYVMLLGKGPLGVHLKQGYLKQRGVYVDYLVPRGAAERSRVVWIGDALQQVGDLNVQKYTLLQVPQQIASAKRPVHLIWSTGAMPSVNGIHGLDICVAMMQSILLLPETATMAAVNVNGTNHHHRPQNVIMQQQQNGTRAQAGTALQEQPSSHLDETTSGDDSFETTGSPGSVEAETGQDDSFSSQAQQQQQQDNNNIQDGDNGSGGEDQNNNNNNDADDDDDMQLVQPTSFDEEDTTIVEQVKVPFQNTVTEFCNPGIPPLKVRQAYLSQVAKRSNDKGLTATQLVEVAATNENFRAALRSAVLVCVTDSRRFPFLARQLASPQAFKTKVSNSTSSPNRGGITASEQAATSSPNAMLMLFLEMISFTDLYYVTPVPRRQQIASRIAHKFFLPTRAGNDLVPPMFDFHQIVPDSCLRELEHRLKKDNGISRDLFFDFELAALESLSGLPFCSFLVSTECARMRAYLSHTAPFINVPLGDVFDALTMATDNDDNDAASCSTITRASAKNYFLYLLAFLLCQTDKEGFGEYDHILAKGDGTRVDDAASTICAALFIQGKVLPAIKAAQKCLATTDSSSSKAKNNDKAFTVLISVLEQLWEVFVAPNVGALDHSWHSNEVSGHLKAFRSALEQIRSECNTQVDEGEDFERQVAMRLLDENNKILEKATMLSDELVYDYATHVHPKFKEHKFHEWLCSEFAKARGTEETCSEEIPPLPVHCVKRLLRRVEFPVGVAHHKPMTQTQGMTESEEAADVTSSNESLVRSNAECAVVFGTSVGMDLAAQLPSPALHQQDIRRYTCQQVLLGDDDTSSSALTPEQVPPTLESYVVVPPLKPRPFQGFGSDSWISSDGWEVSLVNFIVPRAEASPDEGEEDSALYGVSLLFRQRQRGTSVDGRNEQNQKGFLRNNGMTGSANGAEVCDSRHPTPTRRGRGVDSPLSDSKEPPECTWTERISLEVRQDEAPVTIGLALVSQRNVIIAMRDALSMFFRSSAFKTDKATSIKCGPLINLLGKFVNQEEEQGSLKSLLEQYLMEASAPWLERPIASQTLEFEQLAGKQLIHSLPPIPLALIFVTALLEQKIVLSSSRRSILLSVTVALSKMLKPLKWCHLMVPLVPSTLAGDLLQYPAPFILGMPSEDPGIMDLIRDLPQDVTLVDLDVGRVILAPSFAHDSELGRGTPNNADTARALRSQVLYLAQSLGGVFGAVTDPQAWCCDRPLDSIIPSEQKTQFDSLCSICHQFLEELLAGTASCCYWLEEAIVEDSENSTISSEPTVLFDEDRFFAIKNLRERNGFEPLFSKRQNNNTKQSSLALALDDFDLVLEVFLRCQSMNAYIGTRPRETMAFGL